VRGLLQYYGANRTGRWAGRLVQVQNLPKNHMEGLDFARYLAKTKRLDSMKLIYGNVPDTLSQLIRTAIVPPPGMKLLIADFSAIEARVIAWLAMEMWRLEVFKTHGKIYEASASSMFGIPLEDIDKDMRQRGKVAELALGYQGAVGALIRMGALEKGVKEEELPEIVARWRKANKRIVELWYRMERAAVECIATGLPQMVGKGIVFALESQFESGQAFLTIQLPSGRKLYYVKPALDRDKKISYWGMNQITKKWEMVPTYGGKLVENIVQAISRDCLAVWMQRCVAAGYKIVMHVHDEGIAEATADTPLQPMLDLMKLPISWAPGLPLKGEGFITDYYKKD
jgi:DNA polymerase